MSFHQRDTEWATSAKGNTWKRTNGVPMIVGQRKDGKFWARRGDSFIKGSFSSIDAAMHAAEFGGSGDSDACREDDEYWG